MADNILAFAGVLLFQVIESGIDESDERLSGLL